MARNRKRAKARSSRPPRPAASRPGVAGTRENGRANVEPLSPELEPEGIVERDEAEPRGPAEAEIAAVAEAEIAAEAEAEIAAEAGAGEVGDPPVPSEPAGEAEDVDAPAEPPREAEGEVIEYGGDDRHDVEYAEDEAGDDRHDAGYAEDEGEYDPHAVEYAEHDDEYDEGLLEDEDEAGVAVAAPAGPRRRPTSKERKAASREPGTAVAEHHVSAPARLIQFLQGSWRELQRVQWPDRRQVMQATGVVVGFVIVAGAFLGFADYLSTKLINFILK